VSHRLALAARNALPRTVVVVPGAQHLLACKRRIDLAELAKEAWALPPRGGFVTPLITEAFHANGFAAPRIAVVATAYMRLMLPAVSYSRSGRP
jgi:DNA-binding transcriptional LysR family regulator